MDVIPTDPNSEQVRFCHLSSDYLDGLPRREVVGQEPPLAAAFEDVEDGIEDLTEIMDPRASMSCGVGHVRSYVVPLGIGKIRRVRFSHAC